MEGKIQYKKFYQTDIWQEGFELVKEVYKITREYPEDERFALTSQTRRSSNSVLANSAEAHGRFYFKDKIRVMYIVRGEIEETQSHLWVAHSQKYIKQEKWLELEKRYESLKIKVNNQINDWHKQKN
ncbi:four helix bundle protein, partial [Patescibacteria group bacterium]|nr:four helix bundle protein [Patescibacteria group bacterium]